MRALIRTNEFGYVPEGVTVRIYTGSSKGFVGVFPASLLATLRADPRITHVYTSRERDLDRAEQYMERILGIQLAPYEEEDS